MVGSSAAVNHCRLPPPTCCLQRVRHKRAPACGLWSHRLPQQVITFQISMSKSCKGLLKELVKCLRESECMKVSGTALLGASLPIVGVAGACLVLSVLLRKMLEFITPRIALAWRRRCRAWERAPACLLAGCRLPPANPGPPAGECRRASPSRSVPSKPPSATDCATPTLPASAASWTRAAGCGATRGTDWCTLAATLSFQGFFPASAAIHVRAHQHDGSGGRGTGVARHPGRAGPAAAGQPGCRLAAPRSVSQRWHAAA